MIRRVRSRWRAVLLVCAKCEKKLDGRGFGPGGRAPLSRLLRKRAGGKGRKAAFGVVSARCLKICPKRAVTVVDATRPDDWLVVQAGTAVDAVAEALGLYAADEERSTDASSTPSPACAGEGRGT